MSAAALEPTGYCLDHQLPAVGARKQGMVRTGGPPDPPPPVHFAVCGGLRYVVPYTHRELVQLKVRKTPLATKHCSAASANPPTFNQPATPAAPHQPHATRTFSCQLASQPTYNAIAAAAQARGRRPAAGAAARAAGEPHLQLDPDTDAHRLSCHCIILLLRAQCANPVAHTTHTPAPGLPAVSGRAWGRWRPGAPRRRERINTTLGCRGGGG